MLDLNHLSELARTHSQHLSAAPTPFELRGQSFQHWPEVAMMGVVNLSQDSWYRESVAMSVDAAVRRGRRLAEDGARIIDLGAESTVLSAKRVDAKTQSSHLLPVVQELNSAGLLVSVESYHPEVTRVSLEAGAALVNLTAAEDTEPFYTLAAAHQAGVVICYIQNGKNVRTVGDFNLLPDHTAALYEYFARETERAVRCGVSRIWIDPGLGFYYKNLADSAVRVRYQIETFLNTFRLRSLGWPVCQALPHAFEYFEEEVRSAEPFFGVLALLGKTDLLRTHEVAKVRGVIRAMNAFA
ncbi:MAG: Dihydropteroate synthase [Verrucomicrobia bacterium]|nr:MAG: Dihydropteroate synthase [Verrucomicrobiota bacterium]